MHRKTTEIQTESQVDVPKNRPTERKKKKTMCRVDNADGQNMHIDFTYFKREFEVKKINTMEMRFTVVACIYKYDLL